MNLSFFLRPLLALLLLLMVTGTRANKLQTHTRVSSTRHHFLFCRDFMSFSVVPSWQRPPSTSFPGQSQPPSTASPPGGSPSATLDARLPRAWGVCWLTTGPPSSAQRCVGALDSPVTAEQKAGILILVNKRLYSMNTCTQGTHQFGLLNLFILRTLL